MHESLDISKRNLACHAIWGSGLFALWIVYIHSEISYGLVEEDVSQGLLIGVCISQLVLSAGWVALSRPRYWYRVISGLLLGGINAITLISLIKYGVFNALYTPTALIPFNAIAIWAFSAIACVIFRVLSGGIFCHRDDIEKISAAPNRQISIFHLVSLTFFACVYLAMAKVFVPGDLWSKDVVFNDCLIHSSGAMVAALPLAIAILLPRPSGFAIPIAATYAFSMVYIENYIYHFCTGYALSAELGTFTVVIVGTNFCTIVFCALARLSGYTIFFPAKSASPPSEADQELALPDIT